MPKRARDAEAAPAPAPAPPPAQAAPAAPVAPAALFVAMLALLGGRAPILLIALILAEIDVQRQERKGFLDQSFKEYKEVPPLPKDKRAEVLAILKSDLTKNQPALSDEQRREVVDYFTTTKMILSTCGRFACVTERREFEGIRVSEKYTKGGFVVTYTPNDGTRAPSITREFEETEAIARALVMDEPDNQTASDDEKKTMGQSAKTD